MEDLNDGDFKKFLESYNDGFYEDEFHNIHYFHDNITELSRSDTEDEDPLVENKQEMYGLDWIVKASKKFGDKPPKSTDALFFKENPNGKSELHIIEFKFLGRKSYKDKINILWSDICKKLSCENCRDCEVKENDECFNKFFISDFKRIRKNFKDPVNVSLQLKPYEVIFITLPKLYEEYCDNNSEVKRKDITSYLNKIDKYYWTFVGNFSLSEDNIESKAKSFNGYNKRLEMTIFKKARAKPYQKFNNVLKTEILKTNSIDDFINENNLSDLIILD